MNLIILREVRVGWLARKSFTEQVRPVALTPLSAAQWQANRGMVPRPSSKLPSILPPVLVKPKPPLQTPTPPGQVVDVAPSKNNAPPPDTRFASDRNNTVDKETRARDARAGFQKVLPQPSRPSPTTAGATVAEKGGAASQVKASGDGRKAGNEGKGGETKIREQPPRQRLALQFDPSGQLRSQISEDQQGRTAHTGLNPLDPPGQGGERGSGTRPGKPGQVDLGKLMPSASFYDQLVGGPAPDHLRDVEEGEGTFLNTREWKYATYFNRIKQVVGTHWDPNRELLARDPTGNAFGYKDRMTILAVTLNDQGALTDIAVQKTCGVDFLDRTAVDAFRKAQPFVNPPRGLVNQGGEIKFTFGFYLEFGSPGLRLFRGPALQ